MAYNRPLEARTTTHLFASKQIDVFKHTFALRWLLVVRRSSRAEDETSIGTTVALMIDRSIPLTMGPICDGRTKRVTTKATSVADHVPNIARIVRYCRHVIKNLSWLPPRFSQLTSLGSGAGVTASGKPPGYRSDMS